MQNTIVYAVLYINVDTPSYSEILSIHVDYEKAIDNLIEIANFREKNGILTQYMEPTSEYGSIDEIKNIIKQNNELIDEDIYRIQKLKIQ